METVLATTVAEGPTTSSAQSAHDPQASAAFAPNPTSLARILETQEDGSAREADRKEDLVGPRPVLHRVGEHFVCKIEDGAREIRHDPHGKCARSERDASGYRTALLHSYGEIAKALYDVTSALFWAGENSAHCDEPLQSLDCAFDERKRTFLVISDSQLQSSERRR